MKTKVFGYKGGTFFDEEIEIARREEIPLTLDIAIPGTCLNDCIFCGYKDTQTGGKLNIDEITNIFKQFADLGGKSIKILGEGEPFLRKDILYLLRCIKSLDLQPVVFTCGDVIGDDELSRRIYNKSGLEIAEELNSLKTTLMLKYERKQQDDLVQRKGYSIKRNLALRRLIETGFNQDSPTRLGFGIVILNPNLEEIPANYEWALKNNVYPLLCALMPIGKAADPEYRIQIGIGREQMVDLSARLYEIAGKNGIKIKCPADFPGGLPCDIARAGFYIGDTGDIYLCESEEKVGNIRDMSLSDAWTMIKRIKDEKYGEERWSGFCYAKRHRGIFPINFDKQVRERLDKNFQGGFHE